MIRHNLYAKKVNGQWIAWLYRLGHHYTIPADHVSYYLNKGYRLVIK